MLKQRINFEIKLTNKIFYNRVSLFYKYYSLLTCTGLQLRYLWREREKKEKKNLSLEFTPESQVLLFLYLNQTKPLYIKCQDLLVHCDHTPD